jgi:thiol-disulfide isomerase/thioredoxin
MANTQREIYTELTVENIKALQTSSPVNTVLIIKFGAEWCKPCKIIKNTCEEWFTKLPPNIICADIDVDESLDLFMALKTKKMIKGVPTLLAWWCSGAGKERERWYIPDDSVSGGDIKQVNDFFERCLMKVAQQ